MSSYSIASKNNIFQWIENMNPMDSRKDSLPDIFRSIVDHDTWIEAIEILDQNEYIINKSAPIKNKEWDGDIAEVEQMLDDARIKRNGFYEKALKDVLSKSEDYDRTSIQAAKLYLKTMVRLGIDTENKVALNIMKLNR